MEELNKKENSDGGLNPGEAWDEQQCYVPVSGIGLENFSAILEDMLKPPGRFRSPMSALDRAEFGLHKNISKLQKNILADPLAFIDPAYPVPHRWQMILNYLYEQKVIDSPHIAFERLFHDEPKLYAPTLMSTITSEMTDGRTFPAFYAGSFGWDLETTISKSIGEIIERYTLLIYRKKELLMASIAELERNKKRFVNIFDCAGWSESQKSIFPRRIFDRQSKFSWVKGRELISGNEALMPGQFAFWNYSLEENEPFLRETNTNGAAGHFTYEEAVLAGLYETIQRDAFLVYWMNGVAPPKIDLETIQDNRTQEAIRRVKRYGLTPIFLDTTLDLAVPSTVCVLIDESGVGPALTIGGGCGFDFAGALFQSLTEAIGVRQFVRNTRGNFSLPPAYEPFRDFHVDHHNRMYLWARKEMLPQINFFLSGKDISFAERRSRIPVFRNFSEELSHVLKHFKEMGSGYEVYAYEASHQILKTLGFHAVKVAVPALIPLYLTEPNAALGAPRLHKALQTVGHMPQKSINRVPHPFP